MFDGVDTVADVYLGTNRVLQARNFHRRHVADASQLLNSSSPQQLRVVLQPALRYSQEQYDMYPYEIPTNRAVGAWMIVLCLEGLLRACMPSAHLSAAAALTRCCMLPHDRWLRALQLSAQARK